jgi:hypothetical protein
MHMKRMKKKRRMKCKWFKKKKRIGEGEKERERDSGDTRKTIQVASRGCWYSCLLCTTLTEIPLILPLQSFSIRWYPIFSI